MASPSIDSNAMTNFISSTLPSVASMGACYDEAMAPMLLYADSVHNKFFMVHQDPTTGQNIQPIDISAILSITDPATHISVSQSPDGYVSVALASTSTTNSSQVHIVGPCLPQDLKTKFAGQVLKPSGTTTSQFAVSRLVMTPTTAVDDPPQVAVVTSAQDAQHIQLIDTVTQPGNWSWSTTWKLPENPSEILDTAFAVIEDYPALWALSSHEIQGNTIFTLNAYSSIDGQNMHTRKTTVPNGLTKSARIAVVANSNAEHDLLLLGAGLHHYNSDSFTSDGAIGKVLSQSKYFDAVTQASLHQQEGDIRLWFQSLASTTTSALMGDATSGTMCYTGLTWDMFDTNTQSLADSAPIAVVPMTTDIQGQYVALVTPPNDVRNGQHFIYHDTKSQFTVASQSTSGAWNASMSHFSIPYPETITQLQTFTTNITYDDPSGATKNHSLTISASDTCSPFINGVRYSLGASTTATVEVIPSGKLVILHETTDLVVPILTVQEVGKDSITIDPTAAVQEKLCTLGQPGKLQGTKIPTESGGSTTLLGGSGNLSQDAIDKATANFAGLALQATAINGGKAVAPQIRTASQVEGIGQTVDDLWHWAEHVGSEAIQWIKKEGEALSHFVVEIADGLYTIAVQTIHDVVRVAHIILKGLKIAWDYIKAFVGALFNWKAIIHAQQEIHASLSAAVSYGRTVFDSAIDGIITLVNKEFKKLENDLSNLDFLSTGNTGSLVSNMASQKAPDSDAKAFGSSSKGSLVTGAITHGNSARSNGSRAVTPNSTTSTHVQKVNMGAKNWLGGPDTLKKLEAVGQDFAKFFTNGPSLDGMVKLFKDVIILVLDLVNVIADDILELIKLIADDVFAALDAPIEFPIIGPLLKWVAKTFFDKTIEFPSILGIMSFMLAIVKVEIDAFSSVPINLDIVSCFPPVATAAAAAKAFFAGLGPSDSKTSNLSISESLGSYDDGWKQYSLACAVMHPVSVFLKFVLTGPLDAAEFVEGSLGFEVDASICEKINLATEIVDMAFSCPANTADMRPSIDWMNTGYAIAVTTFIAKGLGGLLFSSEIEEAGPVGNFIMKSVEASVCAVKLSLYAKGLHDQIETDKGQWAGAPEDQKDTSDLKDQIGNLTCEYTETVASWALGGLGPLLTDEGAPEVGIPVAGVAVIIDWLANAADYGVDQARGVKEIQAYQHDKQKGVYCGVKT